MRAGTLPGGHKADLGNGVRLGYDPAQSRTSWPCAGPAGGLPPGVAVSALALGRLGRPLVALAGRHLRSERVQYRLGRYFRGDSVAADRPKPSLTAFRFPFVARRRARAVELWGLAPHRAGTVRIERSARGRWRRMATARTRSGRVFSIRRDVAPGMRLRARAGGAVSLVATVR